MDGSYGKQGVSGTSASKKKLTAAVSGRDGTDQLCNRIGCSGRTNNNTKCAKNKELEKPKPLKPSVRSSTRKEVVIGGSSKKCVKSVESTEKRVCSKIESSSGSNGSEVQEVNASGTQARKLKCKSIEIRKEESSLRVQNGELSNGRKKRLTQGESSSSGKGKKIVGVSTNEGRVSDLKNSRSLISSRTNGVSSVRTRKTVDLGTSKGSNSQQAANDIITNMPQTQDLSLNGDHSTNDASTVRSAVGFGNDSGTRHYSIDGIADVLLALNRFEQDDELSYEQLLSLEANLLLGGLSLFDQHRDMRLDIDNMSYEELLVLEEKMGTVSTALSEEELSQCIKTCVYECSELEDEKMRRGACADDNKCSICQEEFVRGDEVGRLGCGHGYHTPCINHWLGLKNWCPICKASPKPLCTHA